MVDHSYLLSEKKLNFDTLLIAASFFGYSKEIKTALEAQGRQVLWFEDRPGVDARTKMLLRVAPSLIARRTEMWFDSIVQEVRRHNIRDVLVIKGEALTPALIRKLKAALPRARFVLYYWDSYRNMPNGSREKVDLFDRAFSFDPMDVKKDVRLKYRPLFFLPEYARLPARGNDIDVLFVGTAHTDRYAVTRKLREVLPSGLNYQSILYVPARKLFYAKKVLDRSYWGASKSEFVFKPLGKAEVVSLIGRSRIVVDIERPIQTGYTMRTIEMLGGSRKLMTTNPLIGESDFFHESNQTFFDRSAPQISPAFFDADWKSVRPEILDKYSLKGWIRDVFES